MKILPPVLFAAAALLASCSRSNNLLLGQVETVAGGHTIRVTDCYRTSVPPAEETTGPDGRPAYRFKPCRDADIEIRGGELTVNGRSYGPIKDSDDVLVDHGVVSVNPASMRR